MIVHDVEQGSPEWLSLRANYFTASEAPAMLGLSKYMTRAELLRQKATGIVPEVSAQTQRLFDAGHAAEAAARSQAEQIIGESLYPATGSLEEDGLPLLASFDGLTMDESINWENKLWNEVFAAQVREGIAPDTHWPQMEHQMIVSGAGKVLFTVSDGADNIVSMWYESDPKRRDQVISGWKQFAEDIANYQHVDVDVKPVAATIDALPALMVQVEGRVLATNLDAFKSSALAFIAGINTNLQTDQDFADAEKTVKFCKDGEERLELVKSQALAQTASIDELFRAIDSISAELKAKRLMLDKLVKAEKENRKAEIVGNAQAEYRKHVDVLNKRIGGQWMPSIIPAFAESIKGLKSLDSMRDKIATAMANAKIEANETADRIEANAKILKSETQDFWPLFQDFAQLCTKPTEDFALLVGNRFTKYVEAQNAEREKIRAEEAARADREAKANAQAEADRIRAEERVKAEAEAAIKLAQQMHDDELAASLKRQQDADEAARVATTNTTPEGEPAMPAGAGLELAQPVVETAPTVPTRQVEDGAVLDHQQDIAEFLKAHDFKDEARVRAILVEFVKFLVLRAFKRTKA